jgi:superfamily II DNA or RNA helicase
VSSLFFLILCIMPNRSNVITLVFHDGMLHIRGEVPAELSKTFFRKLPDRVFSIAPAYRYREIIDYCNEYSIEIADDASRFFALPEFTYRERLDPFDFQIEALKAWEGANRRGLIVLPTGAGKSFTTRLLIASLAVTDSHSSVLIVVPTRTLMYQWHSQLRQAFGIAVGLIGDDFFDLQPVTVTTYASARIHMPSVGNRWKFIVFDEVHGKLSGDRSSVAAKFSMAPYRLGLTATPSSETESVLRDLIGEIVYLKSTDELIEREILSVYETRRVHLKATAEEISEFNRIREPVQFLWEKAKQSGRVRDSFWLVRERVINPDEAALAQRALLRAVRYWQTVPSRLHRLEEILKKHREDRILIFTESRQNAYEISRRFLIPAVTADIDSDERDVYLKAFAEGTCRALVTSRALEEGIDLPDANVAVILAGRKRRSKETIRYIQRRGRILRKRKGKKAKVYEIAWAQPVTNFVHLRVLRG